MSSKALDIKNPYKDLLDNSHIERVHLLIIKTVFGLENSHSLAKRARFVDSWTCVSFFVACIDIHHSHPNL